MNTIGSAATKTPVAINNTNSAQSLANLGSLASSFTSSTSSASSLNFNTLILNLLMQIVQALLKNMQNKNCCHDQPSKPSTLNLSTDQLHQLNNGPIVNWNSADTKDLQITDKDGSGSVTTGDTLSVPVPNNTDKPSTFTHQLTEDESQVINGNYGKTLGQYTSPLLTTSDLTVNPPNPINEALAKALQLDTTHGDYLRVVFDKDGNGELSQGDIAVIDHYGASPVSGNLPPRFATGPYIELTADIVDRATIKPIDNKLSLSTAEQNKLLDIVTLGRRYINTPSLVNVTDKDNSGSLSIGDQITLKSFSGRYDQITEEPIFNYSTEALTAEQFNNYQNLTAD